MYDNNFLDLIKSKIVLSDIIGRTVQIIRHGRNKVACCPFHKEKTPSFNINDDKGFYHCFGCGAHGDVISFIMAQEGLDFKNAVEKLANDNGIELPKLDEKFLKKQQKIRNEQDIIYRINEEACKFFENNIFKNSGRCGLDYILNRGLSQDNIKKFRIGFAINSFDNLLIYLRNLGFSDEDIKKSGVVAINEKGIYDKFRNRIIFPILDNIGRVIAFTGRVIDNDDLPKYMNSPDTSLYHKSDVLFNYYFAKKAIYDNGNVIIVEGNLDALSLSINGIENVVAPMGTAITKQQIEKLWKITDEIIVCLDGDNAGQKASKRLAMLVLPMLLPIKSIKFIFLPNNQDPDDLIRSLGSNGFIDFIKSKKNSLSLSEFIWLSEIKNLNINVDKEVTPEIKSNLEAKLIDISKRIENNIVSKNFLNFYKKQLFNLERFSNNKKTLNYQNMTRINYKKSVDLPNSISSLKRNIIIIEKNILFLLIHNPYILKSFFESYNIDISSINFLDINALKIIDIISKNFDNKDSLLYELEKSGFNNYINSNMNLISFAEEKYVKYLYSLFLERNAFLFEIELKELALKDGSWAKRTIIYEELELLRKKKTDLDNEIL